MRPNNRRPLPRSFVIDLTSVLSSYAKRDIYQEVSNFPSLCGRLSSMEESASLICANLSNECVLEERLKSRELHTYRPFDEKETALIHHERHLDSSIGDDQVVTSGSKNSSR